MIYPLPIFFHLLHITQTIHNLLCFISHLSQAVSLPLPGTPSLAPQMPGSSHARSQIKCQHFWTSMITLLSHYPLTLTIVCS